VWSPLEGSHRKVSEALQDLDLKDPQIGVGKVELTLGDERYLLARGDSVVTDTASASWENLGSRSAEVIVVSARVGRCASTGQSVGGARFNSIRGSGAWAAFRHMA
jgi:hypothetical protein